MAIEFGLLDAGAEKGGLGLDESASPARDFGGLLGATSL